MLGQGTMARFAGHPGVLAGGSRFRFLVMALYALRLAGERYGALANQFQRSGPVVSVPAETLGNYRVPNEEKKKQASQQNDGRTDEMSRIPKNPIHA